ncbi:MAG: hypothetical protein M0Q49_03600 [Porticoccaceae bacterium]|nr:hypothetical protein [Porticoccaceae bacterium]
MRPSLYVRGMLGLGDNLHQRALVRAWLETHRVWLETPWPCVYHDMRGPDLRLLPPRTRLRTQLANVAREQLSYSPGRPPVGTIRQRIWYTHEGIRTAGSFLGAMAAESDLVVAPEDIRMPIPSDWTDCARQWLARYRPDRPLLLYRPLVERTEWAGCHARNPDPDAYVRLLNRIRDRFFVVSVADLVPGVEWAVTPDIGADVTCHRGELSFELLAALATMASLVWCSPGFMLVLAQAVGAPLVGVFGGHESARLYHHRWSNNHFIEPARPCECFSKEHGCDKRIDLPVAERRLEEFVNGLTCRPPIAA